MSDDFSRATSRPWVFDGETIENDGFVVVDYADLVGNGRNRDANGRLIVAAPPEKLAKEVAKDIRQGLVALGLEGGGIHLPAGSLAVIAKHVRAALDEARRQGIDEAIRIVRDYDHSRHASPASAGNALRSVEQAIRALATKEPTDG